MKVSELKRHLNNLSELHLKLDNGKKIPVHFHITEMGISSKYFIDCGGKIHTEKFANIQVWVAKDRAHRLKPSGLLKIIEISSNILKDEDLEIEIEYQTDTIGKYSLAFEGNEFVLISKHTNCLAKDNCGIDETMQNLVLNESDSARKACCSPDNGCC